ncbi:MAG TPA: hypothetical protein VGN93_01635 [Shinella sp.]|uniref:hypothetical protein n=1 Tax=Shinella sp. TaxID=1870904 RepID=UPI002E150BF6|nr:hypothetical protein [Shinella sp.]
MTEKKADQTSDAARTGDDADKNRDELVKKAEQGVKDAVRKDKRKTEASQS